MNTQTVTEVVNFLTNNPGYLKCGDERIAFRIGCTVDEAKMAKQWMKSGIEDEIDKIKSPLDTMLEDAQIDKSDVNHYWYKGEHFSIHAKNPQINAKEQFKILLEESKKNIQPIEPKEYNNSGNCAVINIYDIHLDKRDVRNPNGGLYAKDKLVEELELGFSKLLSSVLIDKPSVFILPVGNDLFTTNGFMKTTKKGTPQDPMITHEQIFKDGLGLIRKFIDTLSQYGKVYVPIIYGNHSVDAEFYLGVCLETLYENNANVLIENTLKARKYITYQNNLFGFGHGDLEKKNIDKLPLIMATENPKEWGNTKYRVFYLGDIHHRQEFKFFRTKDNPGCMVQFLRSTSITDSWHEDNMFVGVPRSMEATIWSPNNGQISNYNINL